jgi:hypothetical protein
MTCVVVDLVATELDRVPARIAGRFTRSEPRGRVREYVSGLVAGLERKNWSGWPERAGGSRNASSRPRTKPAWTTTRSVPGGPGTPTSPCRCSPTPGSRSPGSWPQRGNQPRRNRRDRLHATGNPPPADQIGPAVRPYRRTHLVLVHLASQTSVPSQTQPL